MGRSEQREHIFKLLFQIEFTAESEMPEQVGMYFDLRDVQKDSDREYICKKYEAVAEKVAEIDTLLNEYATGWKTSRMNKVDLAILRLAVYEVKWDDEVPTAVAINEAVELAKKYSSEEGPAFINGILAKAAG